MMPLKQKKNGWKNILEEVKREILAFKKFDIKQIPRSGNVYTDSLATLASIVSTKL